MTHDMQQVRHSQKTEYENKSESFQVTIQYVLTSAPNSPSPDNAPYIVARAAFSDLTALLNVFVILACMLLTLLWKFLKNSGHDTEIDLYEIILCISPYLNNKHKQQ